MSNYYHHQQEQTPYDYEPQQHQYYNHYQHDAYAMSDMIHSQQRQSSGYYPHYDAKPQPATADGYYSKEPQPLLAKHQRLSQVAAEFNEKYSRANTHHRKSCCDMICCGCCTCCPRWCRWISCILLLIIIALGIVVGVLAALFKTPSVEFTGVQGSPSFTLAGTTANMNVSLGFTVNNPNIESVTFKSLVATAYYHGDSTELGGGTLNNLHIGSHSITNISFPFAIAMNIMADTTKTVVTKLMSDCGIDGGTAKDINLDYKVVATVSIIGIPISVPFSSSVSFACPIDGQSSSALQEISTLLTALSGNGDTLSSINSAVNNLPSNVTSSLPA
ncbi:hypothetical protein [Parasitella parasitica]|uniref:Late embryogenesis abundant protein LEA-2 subgroup domain-containing protein n=1 Tax=Parasitella parasitica TaxID=35722 RepID=A0A0B7NC07_9FUNG|nr:hypothetical protein [Parasitella parasitica]